jgi:hypothetical protein
LAEQAHIDFFKQAIAFFAIACFTGSYKILPRAQSTTGAWYYVIECQFAAMLATILARFFITQQDIGSSGLKRQARYAHIGEQLHNDGPFQLKTTGLNTLLNQLTHAIIYKGHLLLRK